MLLHCIEELLNLDDMKNSVLRKMECDLCKITGRHFECELCRGKETSDEDDIAFTSLPTKQFKAFTAMIERIRTATAANARDTYEGTFQHS